MSAGRTLHTWVLFAAALVAAYGQRCAAQQNDAEGSPGAPLVLHTRTNKAAYIVGEPIFVSVSLRNESKESQVVGWVFEANGPWLGKGLASAHWELWMSQTKGRLTSDRGQYHRVKVHSDAVHSDLDPQYSVGRELKPGEDLRDEIVLWWTYFSDLPGEETALVVREPGTYEYRLVFDVATYGAPDGGRLKPVTSHAVEAHGVVEIDWLRGRAEDDYPRAVRTLREIVRSTCDVPFDKRSALEDLIRELGPDCVYTDYVKWLRLRCCLSQEGLNNVEALAEDDDAEAQVEVDLMGQLAEYLSGEEFLTREALKDTLVECDALTALGILHLLRAEREGSVDEKEKARAILTDIEKRFGATEAMRTLRRWAY